MTRRSLALLGAIVAVAFTLNTAHAAVSYSLAFGQSSYQVAPGGTLDLEVYLVETLTEGSTSLVNDNDGLSFTRLLVTRGATAASEPAYIDGSQWSHNPGFDSELAEDLIVAPDGSSAQVELIDEEPPGPMISNGQVYLFTLLIHFGSVVGEVTPFNVAVDPAVGMWHWGFESFSVDSDDTQIEIIPEPATVLLAGAGLLLMASRRRRVQ